MLLAELEVFHNRPFSPTRRIALGACRLPVTGAAIPYGAVLLGAVAAVGAEMLTDEDRAGIDALLAEVDAGRRIVQPRVRHRFQRDHIGLARSTARLLGGGTEVELDLDGHASPTQMTLAATYAAARLAAGERTVVCTALRRGLRWRGIIGPGLFTHLAAGPGGQGWSAIREVDPIGWARQLLGLDGGVNPSGSEVKKAYRQALRDAHPDHGAADEGAAARIAALADARRILLDRAG